MSVPVIFLPACNAAVERPCFKLRTSDTEFRYTKVSKVVLSFIKEIETSVIR